MIEIRTDYISGYFSLTPIFQAHKEPFCIFCPDNEEITPPAILIFQHKNFGLVKTTDSLDHRERDWTIRVIRHVDPILTPKEDMKYSPEPFASESAKGLHYAIIVGREHDKALHDVDLQGLIEAFIATQETIKKTLQAKGIPYATALADVMPNKKTYIGHPHLEVVGFPTIPPFIKKEASLIKELYEETGTCPYCKVVAAEKNGPRQIISTDYFLSLVPWSPKYDLEAWILPKKHQRSFLKLTQKELRDFALIFKTTLKAIYEVSKKPYSLIFHLGPERRSNYQFHWHMEIFQADRRFSAIEKGLGIKILHELPEKLSEHLSKEARREFANLMGVK